MLYFSETAFSIDGVAAGSYLLQGAII